MPSVNIKDLASGFLKTAKKEVKDITNTLISTGREAAIDLACAALEARTGLSSELCHPVANRIVTDIAKGVRKKLSPK